MTRNDLLGSERHVLLPMVSGTNGGCGGSSRVSAGGRRGGSRHAAVRFALAAAASFTTVAGCEDFKTTWAPPVNEPELRSEAMSYLKQALAYPHSATVRCQAIEALAEEAPKGAEGWFIEALGDDEPAVRFAACVALGRVRYTAGKAMVEQRLGDENHSVRAAAIFALHRMGDTRQSGQLAEMLLYHKDSEVRANAAMLLGLLGERGAINLLERAQKDPSYLVVWQAMESRLLLGDPKALPRVAALANSGREDIRVLAMIALGRTGQQKSVEVLRYRLERKEDHIESRLAAARALGMLGHDDGLELARTALKFDSPSEDPRAGAPQDQIMRVRTMATMALGAMRVHSTLPEVKSLMRDSDDPRTQVAAARAILEILARPEGTGT